MNVQETTGETTKDQGRIAIVITKSETDRQKVTNSLLPIRRTWSLRAVGIAWSAMAAGNVIATRSWQNDYHMWSATRWSLMFGNMIAAGGWQHREPVLSINIADVLSANVDWKEMLVQALALRTMWSTMSGCCVQTLKIIRMPAAKRHR